MSKPAYPTPIYKPALPKPSVAMTRLPSKQEQLLKKPKKLSVAKEIVDQLKENIITPGTSHITFSDIKGQKVVKKAITDNII